MSKRWDPLGSKVAHQERVGRRLFDVPELTGASEDQYFGNVKVTQFWDKQTGEVSLDRLGRSNVEPKVRAYLIPRAESHGATFKPARRFDGWVHIKAQDLTNAKFPPSLVVNASPIYRSEGEEEIKENIYHAHIDRADDPYILALHLRNLFDLSGSTEKISSAEPAPPHLEGDTKVKRGIFIWLARIFFSRRI